MKTKESGFFTTKDQLMTDTARRLTDSIERINDALAIADKNTAMAAIKSLRRSLDALETGLRHADEYVQMDFAQAFMPRLSGAQPPRRSTMSNLKQKLIRLGAQQPSLRPHLRPILASIKQANAGLIEDHAFEAMEFFDEHLFEYGSRSEGRRAIEKLVAKALSDGRIKGIVDGLDRRQLGQFGHDLYLTVQGAGVGFWDGDWRGILPEEDIDYLTTWCERHGEIYI